MQIVSRIPMTENRPPLVNRDPLPAPTTAEGAAMLLKTLAERRANGFDEPLPLVVGPLEMLAVKVLRFANLNVSVELADRMDGIVEDFGVPAIERYLRLLAAMNEQASDEY